MELKHTTITEEHIALAKRRGACSESIAKISGGTSLLALPQSYLRWIEDNIPELASQVAETVPLSLLARSGSGDGDGYGYGYGYGDGPGDGSGYGYGDGYGDGYGYGSTTT